MTIAKTDINIKMAKRKIDLYIEIRTEKELDSVLNKYQNKLICAEIYCSFVGPCAVLDRVLTFAKLDWSGDQMILLKVLADDIVTLNRFWGHSEPVYMFIVRKHVTKLFRGVNQIVFGDIIKNEINHYKQEMSGFPDSRRHYKLNEITLEEEEWYNKLEKENLDKVKATALRRAKRQAARKRHRAEKMAPFLQLLNFVLFWPHAKHAHPELYQRWDDNDIIMVGREEIQLSREQALDVLYEGDAPINDASLHALLAAPALAICFRLLNTETHFVTLVRRILYQDLSPVDEVRERKTQALQNTAFDTYASYSLSVDDIKQNRLEVKRKAKEAELFKRSRRLSEMRRLAVQAREEAMQQRKIDKEQNRLNALKAGIVTAAGDEEEGSIDIPIPEELPEEITEESADEEDDEYFPPAGLLIPGLYSPPNDTAKANGLNILFPRIVADYVTPAPEFLPEHVLVMLNITKRHKAIDVLKKYQNALINMGIFKVISIPDRATHVAYTVKQYDSMNLPIDENDKLVVMLSMTSDIPTLELMVLCPDHISRDTVFGEEECAALFPVTYGDHYPQFEDFGQRPSIEA